MKKKPLDYLLLSELFFNNYHTAVAILDRDFNFIRVNELYAKADERAVTDFPGHNHFEFYPDDEVKAIFEKVVRTKQKYQIFSRPFIYPYNPERGITYWDWTLVPALDDKGEVEILIYTLTNVTEQKRNEIELEQFFEYSSDLLCVVDYNLVIKRINFTVTKLFGGTKNEIVGTKVSDYIHPEEVGPLKIEIDQIIKSNTAMNAFTCRYRCKDGSYIWTEWRGFPLADEKVIYAVGRDISLRKEAEEKQERERQRVNLLLDSLPQMVYLQAPNYTLQYANLKFQEVLGEVQGRTCYQIFFAREQPCEECPTKKVFEDNVANFWECTFANGKHYSIYESPFFDMDGSALAIKIAVDITDKKKSEYEMARLDRLNLIGQMAAGIGHEVRNPMTAVRGFLQMLGEKQDCFKYKGYYDLMIEELDRANAIITEFLSLARNAPSELQKQDLNQIIRDLYPLLQADALNSNNDVILEQTAIPEVYLNKKEIHQLILNLVRNGFEAMHNKGSVIIKTYQEGEEIVLAIQDEGPGVDPSILQRLGTPFLTTKADGTGIGLAMCYRIAEKNNAHIVVKTGSIGTTFLVKFQIVADQ